jgi:hypothetical protein
MTCPVCNTSARTKSGRCIECARIYNHTYRQANKDSIIKWKKSYRKTHRQDINAYAKKTHQNNRTRNNLKIKIFDAYGGCRCKSCGIEDLDVLSIDHVEGGGNKHRLKEKISSGPQFYRWLKKNTYPPGYRVLCMNCQFKEVKSHRILSTNKKAICSRKKRRKTKIQTFTVYGGCRCVSCGIEDLDVLSVDHIDGGGNKHRKEVGGGHEFYCYLRKNNFPDKDKYQILCMNCQFKKERFNRAKRTR